MLSEVVQAVGGRVRDELPTLTIAGVSTDTRTLAPGDLFFAIPGERFDGHAFVAEALRRGASAAVVAAGKPESIAVATENGAAARAVRIEVDDTVAALGRLAACVRRSLAAQVIAVVGSNGKTTTKAMIDHVLSGRLPGRASPKSFNNSIGVPLTLLSAEIGDAYLAVEVGTNAPGEIAHLARIAQPDCAVLTSLAEEHLEGLKDLAGVAREECAVLGHMRHGGFAAVNVDNPVIRPHLTGDGVTILRFGEDASADVRVTDVAEAPPWLTFRVNGRFPYRLRLVGRHNALNAAGAITIALRLGLSHAEIAARLESFAPQPMRGELHQLGGATVIDETYNANPGSAAAAVRTLADYPCAGRRLLVIGEMRELGAHAAALHRRLAEQIAAARIDRLLLVGAAAGWMGDAARSAGMNGSVEEFADAAACGDALAASLRPGDVALLKASRAVRLERAIESLRRRLAVVAPSAACTVV